MHIPGRWNHKLKGPTERRILGGSGTSVRPGCLEPVSEGERCWNKGGKAAFHLSFQVLKGSAT